MEESIITYTTITEHVVVTIGDCKLEYLLKDGMLVGAWYFDVKHHANKTILCNGIDLFREYRRKLT